MKRLAYALFVMTLACAIKTPAQENTPAGKEPVKKALSEAEKETIQKQLRDQFNQLVSAISRKDGRAFERTNYFASGSTCVDTIRSYFSWRDSKRLGRLTVQVTPLAPDKALLRTQEKSEMRMDEKASAKGMRRLVVTWRKEHNGWKIVDAYDVWVDEQPK
jgi:hypothetical protein